MNIRKRLQNNSDVFEMVLKSVGRGTDFANAVVSPKRFDAEWSADKQEGQLAVDVISTNTDIIVVSTMAGADPEQIEVYVHNDLLTIRGNRIMPVKERPDSNYLHKECFWGKFSRTVVLPVDVKGDNARAEYKTGVLTITIPRKKVDSRISVTIVED